MIFPAITAFTAICRKIRGQLFLQSWFSTAFPGKCPGDFSCNHCISLPLAGEHLMTFPAITAFTAICRKIREQLFLQSWFFTAFPGKSSGGFSCNHCISLPLAGKHLMTFPAITAFTAICRKIRGQLFLQSCFFNAFPGKCPGDFSCNHCISLPHAGKHLMTFPAITAFTAICRKNPRATFPAIMVFYCLSRKIPCDSMSCQGKLGAHAPNHGRAKTRHRQNPSTQTKKLIRSCTNKGG